MNKFGILMAALLFAAAFGYNSIQAMDEKPFWTNQLDAAAFNKIQDERLQKAQEAINRMLKVSGKRTIENTLVPYDEALLYLDAAEQQSSSMQEIHPNENFRTTSEKISQKVSAFATDLSLNRQVFDALAAMDLTGADAETRYYVEKTLRDFRLAV